MHSTTRNWRVNGRSHLNVICGGKIIAKEDKTIIHSFVYAFCTKSFLGIDYYCAHYCIFLCIMRYCRCSRRLSNIYRHHQIKTNLIIFIEHICVLLIDNIAQYSIAFEFSKPVSYITQGGSVNNNVIISWTGYLKLDLSRDRSQPKKIEWLFMMQLFHVKINRYVSLKRFYLKCQKMHVVCM